MKNRTIRYLQIGLILISVLCIGVFSFLALYMKKKSSDTISEVGNIYMSGMNERIRMHFQTTIDFRLSDVEDMGKIITSGNYSDMEDLKEKLSYNAKARGFEYLALYSQDGQFEMIYGKPLRVVDPEPFLASLNHSEKKVAVGRDKDENPVVLLGVSVDLSSLGDTTSTAIVAGLPVDYISNLLSLNGDESLVYSHIIRIDGSFVIRSAGAYRESYYERVRAIYGEDQTEDAELHIREMQEAMNAGRDYSAVLHLPDERQHLYCTGLPYSEWFLVTVMPYGALDQLVNQLGLSLIHI